MVSKAEYFAIIKKKERRKTYSILISSEFVKQRIQSTEQCVYYDSLRAFL